MNMDVSLGHHKDRTPTHGYEPTREAAMAAFANQGGARVRITEAGRAFA
jgi:hypothetical protein